MKPSIFAFVLAAVAASQAAAGTFSLSNPLTDDASSGIRASNSYTHAISGGLPATINGVDFVVLSPTSTPDNFSWTATGGLSLVTNTNNSWNPAAGGVTGTGLIALLGSFTYSGGGANPGSSQTFTLSGLTVGTLYDTRLYIRVWDTGGGGRFIDFTMTHGPEVDTFVGSAEDRPGDVLGTGNNDDAYYLNYHFTAKATELEITATVPDTAPSNSGSFHLYALSNQVAGIIPDDDGDGLPNAWETENGLNPNDNGSINPANGANGDPDNDALKNSEELAAGTKPKDGDTDKDGLKDGAEKAVGGSPTKADTDKDGLNDGDEVTRGTKVNDDDTDSDGHLDGVEVAKGSDPLRADSVPPPSGKFKLSRALTDDASSGINASNTYTHAISGGLPATVNAVNFALLSPTVTPANFSWTATGGKNLVTNNKNTWNPDSGGVTGTGLRALLESFTYSGGGADPGSSQTFTLSGLTAGTTYDARLYIRSWDTGGSGRFADITMTHGTEVDTFVGRAEDRPGDVLGSGNHDEAYFLNYRFTAKGTSLEIKTTVPNTAPAGNGSFHLYALSNQVAVGASGTFSLSEPLTEDETSGISSAHTYTHAISGGTPASVNGVDFLEFSPGNIPDGFSWTAGGGMSVVTNNRGSWNPDSGGVTGSGLISLLESFTYSGGGANPGSSQTFTLSGLTVGTIYDTRLYIRVWDTGGGGRFIDFTMSNGLQEDTFLGRAEDRPGEVLGTNNHHQAYYLNYRFAAQSTALEILAAVPASAPAGSGSFHLYGLTNQVVPVAGPLPILSIARPTGNTVTVSWPPAVTGWVLKSSASLAAGSWTAVPGVVNNSVTQTINTLKFFRLEK